MNIRTGNVMKRTTRLTCINTMTNQYFTCAPLADLLADTVLKYLPTPTTVLEPCAGTGSLLVALQKKLPTHALSVSAFEIDAKLADDYGWQHKDFLAATPSPVDVVICNPPFRGERADGGNANRGKDFSYLFLIHAARFSSLLVFIMHANKGNSAFQEKVRDNLPGFGLVERIVVDKNRSRFVFGGVLKSVPSCVFVYRKGSPWNYPIFQVIGHSTVDFDIVDLDDAQTNLLVKRWVVLVALVVLWRPISTQK